MKNFKSQVIFRITFLFILLSFSENLSAQLSEEYKIDENIFYYESTNSAITDYMKERCVLDIYYPTNKKRFATVIWFHGGGLKGGTKFIPERLMNQEIAVVAVNYRLYPKIKCPVYIQDAAAAVAWVFNNIEKYGGDQELIVISGHSAGGYLTSMVGLDKSYLKEYGIDADKIAALVPFSGHTITHMTVREERGISDTQPIIDKYAPLYHVRQDAPPLILITGDRELELLGRYEENAYMMRMMMVAGHKATTLYEMDGYDHGMAEPAYPLLLKEVNRIKNEIK